jgi:voltage-dependent potassium channel beta subunit
MKVSEIALGGWLTFGEGVDDKTAKKCFFKALDLGINFFDVADAYARGKAEELLGKFIKEVNRPSLVISTKLYWPMSDDPNDRGLSRKHIMESIHKSLKRLGTDYVDIYFCHRYDPETPLEEVIRAMDDLIHQGKVLYWGTSVWTAAQLENAYGLARQFNLYPPQAEQPRYHMLDRHIEDEIMEVCRKYGIGITVFSPLAQGVLTGKYNEGIPEGSRATWSEWVKYWMTEENLEKVRKLTVIAQEMGLSMAQLALAWVLRREEVSSAITGASRPEQIEENVKASGVKIPKEIEEKIEEIIGGKKEEN